MKIPLSDQITEAEQHRDELLKIGRDENRLHRAEGIVLTLHLIKTHETQFRQYMAQRSKDSEA